MKIEDCDLLKLHRAKTLVCEVYEYYDGAPKSGGIVKRLETIMDKLDFFLKDGRSSLYGGEDDE